jgi:Zinc finger domain
MEPIVCRLCPVDGDNKIGSKMSEQWEHILNSHFAEVDILRALGNGLADQAKTLPNCFREQIEWLMSFRNGGYQQLDDGFRTKAPFVHMRQILEGMLKTLFEVKNLRPESRSGRTVGTMQPYLDKLHTLVGIRELENIIKLRDLTNSEVHNFTGLIPLQGIIPKLKLAMMIMGEVVSVFKDLYQNPKLDAESDAKFACKIEPQITHYQRVINEDGEEVIRVVEGPAPTEVRTTIKVTPSLPNAVSDESCRFHSPPKKSPLARGLSGGDLKLFFGQKTQGSFDGFVSSATTEPAPKKTPECFYFQQGRCTRGDRCPFLHTPPPTDLEQYQDVV